MTKLKEYTFYRYNEDGMVFMLTKDINGLWYLSNRTGNEIKDTLHLSEEDMVKLIEQDFAPELTDEEKARRYDDLHGWYLWLKRRTHGGRTAKSHVEVFLKGFGEVFKKGE